MTRRPRIRVAKRAVKIRRTQSVRRQSTAIPSPTRRLHNLPVQLTTFIGREQEIAEVKHRLVTNRLLTLTGAGGCGKTRLALQVAAGSLGQYLDGVWLVELAPLADPALVPNSVAAALDVPEQPTRPLADTLADYLGTKTLLLVLDNCEHLRASCQNLTDHLLRASETVRILATSREALGVEGESTYRVPPLGLPDVRQAMPVAHLAEYDAIRLFAERAALRQPGFTVTTSNAGAILQICRRLDGLPLAIEFASARASALSVQQIAERLDDRFRLLTAEPGQTGYRQQTLRASLDWSHNLLSEPEQIFFRRLSVFAGGFTLESAEHVCVGTGVMVHDVLNLLSGLVDNSLVVFDPGDGEGRYRLLETVRQYSRDLLQESGEAGEVRRRHREWYLTFVERAEPRLRGPEQPLWVKRLDSEYDNLRAALESSHSPGGAEVGLRLAGALHWFWFNQGYFSEGRSWLERARFDNGAIPPPVRAKALSGAGLLALRQGDLRHAGILLQESLKVFRELEDTWGIAYALHHLSHVEERQRGDYNRASALLEESVALFEETGDKWAIGYSRICLGYATLLKGDIGRATTLLEETLPLAREVGDALTVSHALEYLGAAAERQGNYDLAAARFEEGLAMAQQVGEHHQVTDLLYRLATVALGQGNEARAVKLFRDSLVLRRTIDDRLGVVQSLTGLARAAHAQGHHRRAARILGAADALRSAMGYDVAAVDQSDYDRLLVSTRAALGEKSFNIASARGRTMTLEEVLDYAVAAGGAAKPALPEASHGALTHREREVAGLVAQGLTNREIAASLMISERTADAHVQHILDKLGFRARTQIASWSAEHGYKTTHVE